MVVAEEVRKLADESSKSAKDIFDLVQYIYTGLDAVGTSENRVIEKNYRRSSL